MRPAAHRTIPSLSILVFGGAVLFAGSAAAQGVPAAGNPTSAQAEQVMATNDLGEEGAVLARGGAGVDARKVRAELGKPVETAAGIEAQIVEKQKRLALLLRLFAEDERKFLNDPTNPNADPSTRERRKYEQDELLHETAEIARLRRRAEELRVASERAQRTH